MTARARAFLAKYGHPEAEIELVLPSEILMRDGMECGICSEPILSTAELCFDHIIPLVAGGAHTLDNLQSAHRRCNSRKDAMVRRDEDAPIT